MNNVRVFEKSARDVADFYMVVIDNSVYSMSENPLSPQGVNQYCGELEDFDILVFGEELDCIPKELEKAIAERIEAGNLHEVLTLN